MDNLSEIYCKVELILGQIDQQQLRVGKTVSEMVISWKIMAAFHDIFS